MQEQKSTEALQEEKRQENQVPSGVFRQGSGGGIPLPGRSRGGQPGADRMGENCWDGTVEMEAQGRPEEIRRMIHMIADSRYIVIENIQAREIAVETESGFHIR